MFEIDDNKDIEDYCNTQDSLKLLVHSFQKQIVIPEHTVAIHANKKRHYTLERQYKSAIREELFRIHSLSKINRNRKILDKWRESPFIGSRNYFSKERIAVYTSLFGGYDNINEPITKPDNCDFYIITDQNILLAHSAWKKIPTDTFGEKFQGFSNKQKNRYTKMFPDILFPEYKYSVYIDANIMPVSDFTEYIAMIPDEGLAFHNHAYRSCIYDEGRIASFFSFKASSKDVKHQLMEYRNAGMPERFGLLECPVIAREHKKPVCKKIMREWWMEYLKYNTRDQLSLPYVLYRLEVDIRRVGTLGDNVLLNPTFIKMEHI